MTEGKPLLIVGAGGYGRTVAEAVWLAGKYEPAGFLDDAYPGCREIFGLPVAGDTISLRQGLRLSKSAVVTIGDNRVRQGLIKNLQDNGFELPAIVHPKAWVSPSAVLGSGVTVMAGCVINTEAQIGAGVIVNAGGVVDHHATIEPFAHLGTGCCVAGGNTVKEGVWLRAGCALGYNSETAPWEVYGPATGFGE